MHCWHSLSLVSNWNSAPFGTGSHRYSLSIDPHFDYDRNACPRKWAQLSKMVRSGKYYVCSMRLIIAVMVTVAVSAGHYLQPPTRTIAIAARFGMQPVIVPTITEDGYRLIMYRILPKRQSRGVVLIQHGIRQSSADWLSIPRNLPTQLLAAGLEVWIGNSRASPESAGHMTLGKDSNEFWNFSFHEIGYYDMAAMIDTVLARTHFDQLHLVAYSEGSSAVLTLLSERPSYNAKVASLNLMAPATFLANSHVRELANFHSKFRVLLPWSLQEIITGSNKPSKNSPKQLEHFQQLLVSGRFHQYNYGTYDNQKRYGVDNPPPYSLWRVTAPVTLHFGGADKVVHPKDVRNLATQLHKSTSVRIIEHGRYSHQDFTTLPDAARDVYPLITSAILRLL